MSTKHCGVSHPHPKHGACDGSPGRPWPFPLDPQACKQCNGTGWLHGAQEWTPARMKKGTPYRSVRCDCKKARRVRGRHA